MEKIMYEAYDMYGRLLGQESAGTSYSSRVAAIHTLNTKYGYNITIKTKKIHEWKIWWIGLDKQEESGYTLTRGDYEITSNNDITNWTTITPTSWYATNTSATTVTYSREYLSSYYIEPVAQQYTSATARIRRLGEDE